MRSYFFAVCITITLIMLGCSGSGGIAPETNPVDESRLISSESYGRILWGLWDVSIIPQKETASIIPLRCGQFTANVTLFLQPPINPIDMLIITLKPGTQFAKGYVIADATIRHPFQGMNFYNGFDVRGILLTNGSHHGYHDPSVITAGDGETQLLNADGYTRWWNYPEFISYGTIFGYTPGALAPPIQPSATVSPYKYFADGLVPDAPMTMLDTSKRGFFASNPGINTRRYEIQFEMSGGKPVFHFQYAVDASWSKPDPAYKPTYPPEAFPLIANCREAFMVEVTDAGSTAWWQSNSEQGGELVLDLAISDWQGPENIGGSLGEVSQIWLESPILSGAVEVLSTGKVTSLQALTFVVNVTLDDLQLTKAGTEYLFGTVVSSNPTSYEPQVPGGSGYAYPAAPLAAYFKCAVEIKESTEKPIWPTLQGNRGNTGYVGLYGPSEVHNAPKWTHLWQPNPYGNPLPVFLSADTAFLSNTGDGGPLPCGAVDLINQTTKWNQQFHDDMQNWLNLKAISEDGEVALTIETKYNTIYGLDTDDGSELWHITGTIRVDSYPTTDLDGNFIIPLKDVGYTSVDPHSGTINWTANIGDGYYSVPAVGANGIIYVTRGGQWNRILSALDPATGAVKWTTEDLGDGRMNAVTVHPNGTIITFTNNGLYCFKDNGNSYEIVWQQPYPCPFFASAGVGPSGDVFITDYDGVLRRLDPDTGATKMSTSGWGDGVNFRPAIGADGLIYSPTRLYNENKAFMTCWKDDCTLHWQYYAGKWFMGDGMMSAAAIGQDGALYASYRTLGLCAWKDKS